MQHDCPPIYLSRLQHTSTSYSRGRIFYCSKPFSNDTPAKGTVDMGYVHMIYVDMGYVRDRYKDVTNLLVVYRIALMCMHPRTTHRQRRERRYAREWRISIGVDINCPNWTVYIYKNTSCSHASIKGKLSCCIYQLLPVACFVFGASI